MSKVRLTAVQSALDRVPAPACKPALAGTPVQALLCSSTRKQISGMEVTRTPDKMIMCGHG